MIGRVPPHQSSSCSPLVPKASRQLSHHCILTEGNKSPVAQTKGWPTLVLAGILLQLSVWGSEETVLLQAEGLHLLHEAQAQLLLPWQSHTLHGHGQPHSSFHSLQKSRTVLSQGTQAGTGHCRKGGQRKTNEGTAARLTNTSPAAPRGAGTVDANCTTKQAPSLTRRCRQAWGQSQKCHSAGC